MSVKKTNKNTKQKKRVAPIKFLTNIRDCLIYELLDAGFPREDVCRAFKIKSNIINNYEFKHAFGYNNDNLFKKTERTNFEIKNKNLRDLYQMCKSIEIRKNKLIDFRSNILSKLAMENLADQFFPQLDIWFNRVKIELLKNNLQTAKYYISLIIHSFNKIINKGLKEFNYEKFHEYLF